MLKTHPRIGRRVEMDAPAREIRSLFERQYEIRYEILGDVIYVLRIWHGRENR